MFKIQSSTLALAGAVLVSTVASATIYAAGVDLVTEDFAQPPSTRGWQVFGDTNLFQWNQAGQNLAVTWDSSKPNSFFYHPLGRMLDRSNDFTLTFDLVLNDIAIGTDPGMPGTFEIALGLINLSKATNTDFLRGTGFNSPDLAEFDYFPDSGYGATVAATLISDTNEFNSGGYGFPLELTTNDLFHVQMHFDVATQSLTTTMTRNGQPFGPIPDAFLGTNFSDFHVDCLAISSYSDAGQDPAYAGSILAHGILDNLSLGVPLPAGTLTGGFSSGGFEVRFDSLTNWLYTLERTKDFSSWDDIPPAVNGTGGELELSDTNGPAGAAFYRVKAAPGVQPGL